MMKWPKDLLSVKDDHTYQDADAFPAEVRTKKERKDFADGGFHDIEPVTTLRRPYLGVYAEIVRIAYWIGHKEDGTEFYQVNLMRPRNLGFSRDQRGTVSLDYNRGAGFNEFEGVLALLADARAFIARHDKECQRKLNILIRSPEES